MPTQDDTTTDESTADKSLSSAAREDAEAADSIVDPDDILLHDADGQLKEKTIYVDRLGGEVTVTGLRDVEYHEIIEPFLEDEDKEEVTDDEVAQLIDSHLVEPDLTDAAPAGQITAEFVGKNISTEHQLAFLEAMCRAGGLPDAAAILSGGVPDGRQDLLLEAMDQGVDLSDANQGNRNRR